MYEQSHRDIPALVICIIRFALVMGWLIITVITPLPTKPSATKMLRELEAGERGNY